MTITHHLDDEMLMRYSAGTLAEGWSLGVATHLSLCPVCRSRLAAYDSLGGYLLETDESQADLTDSWVAMKMRLDEDERDNVVPLRPRDPVGGIFPNPLAGYIEKSGGLKWRGLGVGAAQMVEPLVEQQDARIKPLGAAALERELGHHLFPAVAFAADQRIVRQLDIVEMDFAKMGVAGEIADRADRDPGQ